MRHLKFFAAVMMLLATVATAEAAKKDGGTVAYTVLRNYFHNNDAPMPQSPLITTQKEFDAQFGMAAFMGKDGQPTPVNFRRQAVLAIVLPVTDKATDIDSVSVTVTGKNELTLAYTVHEGVERSFSIQPIQLMAIDKRYRGYNVNLAPTVRHDVTVTSGSYQFATLTDTRHDIRLAVDYPASGSNALTDSLRAYLGDRLGRIVAAFTYGEGQPTVVPYSGNADGKSLLQYYASIVADSMEAINRAAGLTFNHCSLVATMSRVWENDRFVSYETDGYSYMGGAHGLGFRDGVTFDKATGRRLTLVKGAPELQKLVTERLHKNVDVPHFDPEPVPMPQAKPYMVGGGKVKFVYQHYEIGPYAIGMPECELYPYEIEQWLTADGKAVAGM